MKGYIYITGTGADPGRGNFNDPLFTRVPTLGACMPNIRRLVVPGDYIFVVSGKVPSVQQLVVGGLRVKEKIDAIAAYNRFPENRLVRDDNGIVQGNIIVTANGKKHPLDHHQQDSFAARVQNFVVGSSSVSLKTPKEIALGRDQTLGKLSDVLGKKGNRVIDVMSRWAKLDERQVDDLVNWLRGIKAEASAQ